MAETPPRFRALRATLFAALCVTLSSTSHVLMSHQPLPPGAICAAFAAVFAVAYLAGGRREWGFRLLAGLMVPLELAVDTWFTAGQQTCYGPSGGPVTGSWRSFHEAVICNGAPVGTRLPGVPGAPAPQVPSATLPLLLLAAHVCVGLLAAWWLRRGEAAALRVARAAGAAAFRPLVLVADAARAVLPARPAAARTAAPAARPAPGRLLRHAVVRRGPPVPAAA